MKKILLTSMAALLAIAVAACASDTADGGGDDDDDGSTATPTPTATPDTSIDVTANITADTTWTADNVYTLKSHIFVVTGTLTIQPGTIVKGDTGSSLVITRGGKINAVGTAAAPIIFTSSVNPGARSPGDWGGVVMLGRGVINVTGGENDIEGFAATLGDLILYGDAVTPDNTHDCGKLKYARIEYAGFELAPDNELNGLTMGGCGSATEVDFVQVHMGADDGVEIFGGAVNIKHMLITQPDDDGLDWDLGWQGKAQFVIVQQNSIVGNYAIEADNNVNNNAALPRSNPLLYNFTLMGSNSDPGLAGKTQGAMLLRRGTAGRFYNFVIEHFTDMPVDIDGLTSAGLANGTDLLISNSILFDNANQSATWPAETDDDGAFDEAAYFNNMPAAAPAENRFVNPGLGASATYLPAPDFRPAAATPALVDFAVPPVDGFFETVDFVGAMDTDADWTTGWSLYPTN